MTLRSLWIIISILYASTKGDVYNENFDTESIGSQISTLKYASDGVVWNETNTKVLSDGRVGNGYGSNSIGSAILYGKWKDQFSFFYKCSSNTSNVQYSAGVAMPSDSGCTPSTTSSIQYSYEFVEVDVTRYKGQERAFCGFVFSGYAFLGISSSPAQVVKVDLANFKRNSSITFNANEIRVACAIKYGGFGFFLV